MFNKKNAYKSFYSSSNKSGFTLIELLIVIAIIGVLAGIVLAVLNPQKQRQRAREGTLRANVNKLCLAYASCKSSSVDETYTECQGVANADNLGVVLSNLNGTPSGATYTYMTEWGDSGTTNDNNTWGGWLDVDGTGSFSTANDCYFYCDATTNIPAIGGGGCATAN